MTNMLDTWWGREWSRASYKNVFWNAENISNSQDWMITMLFRLWTLVEHICCPWNVCCCRQGLELPSSLHTAIQQMAVLPSALYSMDMDIGQCTHAFLWHSEGHFEAELNLRGVVLVIRNSLTGTVDNMGRFDIHVGRSHFGQCWSFSNHKFLNHKLAHRLLQPWGRSHQF